MRRGDSRLLLPGARSLWSGALALPAEGPQAPPTPTPIIAARTLDVSVSHPRLALRTSLSGLDPLAHLAKMQSAGPAASEVFGAIETGIHSSPDDLLSGTDWRRRSGGSFLSDSHEEQATCGAFTGKGHLGSVLCSGTPPRTLEVLASGPVRVCLLLVRNFKNPKRGAHWRPRESQEDRQVH